VDHGPFGVWSGALRSGERAVLEAASELQVLTETPQDSPAAVTGWRQLAAVFASAR
jgi:hypothetical protein